MYSYALRQSKKNPNYVYVDNKRVKKLHYDCIALYADRKDCLFSDKKHHYMQCYLPFEYTGHLQKIWLSGNYVEFYLYQDEIDLMPTTGQCDYACAEITSYEYVQNQLADKQESIVKELEEYGAWDTIELQDKQANIERLIWVLVSDYKENHYE